MLALSSAMPDFGGEGNTHGAAGEGHALINQAVSVEDQVAKIAERLMSEYAERVPSGVVRKMVAAAYRPMKRAKVTQFVPVLVDRTVREQLRHDHV